MLSRETQEGASPLLQCRPNGVPMSDDALRAARELAAGIDPVAAAARCGVSFHGDVGEGRFTVPFLGDAVAISYPELEFDPGGGLPPHVRALLVYYLATSDGSAPLGNWRAFADLPNGLFYSRAFQGYTGDALVRSVGDRAHRLSEAVASLGGHALAPDELATNADSAWVLPGLPRVPVVIVWWDADDEFPARAELLFDVTASSHLPVDGCAVLGSWLTYRLIAEVERDPA
jgi:hypothetical protein